MTTLSFCQPPLMTFNFSVTTPSCALGRLNGYLMDPSHKSPPGGLGVLYSRRRAPSRASVELYAKLWGSFARRASSRRARLLAEPSVGLHAELCVQYETFILATLISFDFHIFFFFFKAWSLQNAGDPLVLAIPTTWMVCPYGNRNWDAEFA